MPAAVRMDDPVTHGLGMVGMLGGAVIGAVVGAAVVMAAPVSLTVGAVIVGGAVAGGALSMKQLIGGVATIMDIPGPTTAVVMVGSPNVYINDQPAAVAQMDLCTPCTGSPCVHGKSPVPVMLAEGSATVYINGKPAVRLGDQTMCGAKTKKGSSNVFIGGGTLSSARIKDNEGLLQTGFEVLGVGALVGAGALAIAAGVGATAIFGAVVAGGATAFKGLGALGNAMGPGYGDLLQGSAGMGTVFAGPRLAQGGTASPKRSDLDRVRRTPKGQRPAPSTYVPKEYIDAHLKRFEGGASYLTKKSTLDTYGRDTLGMPDNSQFVMTRSQMDDVLCKADGDISVVERELGIPRDAWKGDEMVRIDIEQPTKLDLRMPSGNEMGANEHWLPGGKLPTGLDEAVINRIPKGSYVEKSLW